MEQRLRQQPPLVKSVTDDDDSREDQNNVCHESVPNSDSRDVHVDTEALAYLLRYEIMVRQQDAEDMATLGHVRPLLERIELLGRHPEDSIESSPASHDASRLLERQVSYEVLGRALEALEASSEVMTTDRQLMVVLRTLTAKGSTPEENITWAELVQCYKTAVGCIQTLRHLPASSTIRSRARDRTLSMLSLFEPPSMKLLNEDVSHKIDTEDKIFNRYDIPVKEQEIEDSVARKKKSRTSIWVLSCVAVVLVACATAAFGTSNTWKLVFNSQMGDQETSVSDTQPQMDQSPLARGVTGEKPLAERPVDSSPRDKITKPKGNPRLGVPRATPMSPSRPDRLDRLSISKLSREEQQLMLASLLKENPTFGVKRNQIRAVYALTGGTAGMALAPAIWKGVGALEPALRGLVAVASAPAGLGPFALLSAVAVGTLAFASTLIRRIRSLVGGDSSGWYGVKSESATEGDIMFQDAP